MNQQSKDYMKSSSNPTVIKIGILSLPKTQSHGAALQLYALYYTLVKLGCYVEVINYCSHDGIEHYKSNTSLPKRVVDICKKTFVSFFIKSPKSAFRKFEKQIVKYPAKTISTDEELSTLSDRYDRFIVGSDQVWNSFITGSTLGFFLDFVKDNNKKAAYAPSFGTDKVDSEKKDKIANLLKEFQYLSVREKKGAEIIKELTGLDVPVVLDPTFLVCRQEWLKKAIYPLKQYGKYVLYYTVKPSPGLRQNALNFAKKNGFKFVQIGGGFKDFLNSDIEIASGVGPAQFLGLINGAEYIITNSFHGIALSINLHKNFYVEYSSDTNSRLINIIDTFNLNHCVVKGDLTATSPIKIDYTHVDSILVKLKEKSQLYLKSIIKEAK